MTNLKKRIITLFPLLLLIFIDEMGNALFYPLLPPIILDPIAGILPSTTSDAVRLFDYGLVLAIFPLMMFIGAPIFGDLSDNYGRKKVLTLSLVGTILGYLLTALGVNYHSIEIVLLGRAIDGLTAGSFPVAQAAIIDLSEPDEKAENISLLVFAISLGFIIGPLMSAALSTPSFVSWFNLSTPLYAASLLGLINVIAILLLFHETHHVTKKVTFNFSKAVNLFVDAFRYPEIRYLSVILLFLLLGWETYIQYIGAFLFKEYLFAQHSIAAFNVVMAISIAVTSLLITQRLLKYWSLTVVTILALFISCSGVLITVLGHHAIFAWLGIVPISMGLAISHATMIALYSDEVDDSRQGWVMGITASVKAVAIASSAILDGVFGAYTSRTPLWLALLFYGLAASLSLVKFQLIRDSKP